LDDTSKPDEEMPKEVKDEKVEQPQPEAQTEETPKEIKEETKPQEPVKEKAKPKEGTPEKKGKPAKPEVKKELPKRGPDFRYIVRIANTDINGEKSLIYGLATVKGVGLHMSTMVADLAGLDRMTKVGDLKDDQIEKIKEILGNINKLGPKWMLNHRKDYETGADLHLIGIDIDTRLREEINIMKKIRSYKGVRHEAGLPVRGQRTRAHGRIGLAMGVSRKIIKEAAAASKGKEKEKGKE
jgi:small subunit ribosomal protein S13